MINYSILELGFYVDRKFNALKIIEDTLSRAETIEKWGFKRIWISEHHGDGCAWQAPEIVLTLIAGMTDKIRVGVAGVLLSVHIPLLVSQNYKLLNNLFQNRIDLGFSKGRPPKKDLYDALLDGRIRKKDLNEVIKKIQTTIRNSDRGSNLPIPPLGGLIPDMWILAMHPKNLTYAYENNMHCCFTLCHRILSKLEEKQLSIEIQKWRRKFKAKHLKIAILITVICSDTEEKSNTIAKNNIFDFLKLNFSGNLHQYVLYENELLKKYKVDEIIIANTFLHSSEFLETIYRVKHKEN